MIGLVLLLLFALFVAFCLKLFRSAVCRPPCPPAEEKLQSWADKHWDVAALQEGLAWYRAQKTVTISITSFDGLRLVADYLPAQQPVRGRVILLHGYHGGLEDFSAMLPFYHQQGYDLLLPDQRAHNRSEGAYIGFGIIERRDCLQWAQEADRRWGEAPTFLAGLSMGASTVLMASGFPLPRDVRGIIADCGFTSPKAIMTHVMHQYMHLPTFPIYPIEVLICWLRTGHKINDYSTLKAMEENRLPVLFIHGEADKFVPMDMSRQNWAACRAEKRLFLVPGVGHCRAYLGDTPGYQRELSTFLEQHRS